MVIPVSPCRLYMSSHAPHKRLNRLSTLPTRNEPDGNYSGLKGLPFHLQFLSNNVAGYMTTDNKMLILIIAIMLYGAMVVIYAKRTEKK